MAQQSRAAAAAAAKQLAEATVPSQVIAALEQIITPSPAKPDTEVVRADMLVKQYEIVQDAILGEGHTPEAPAFLKGIVTKADLDAAGVDFDWLLRSGAIVEAGYAPTT